MRLDIRLRLKAGLKDAAVIDVRGTTTDVGLLVGNFPRSRSEGAMIAGVRANFRMPDVFSFGRGGGSLIRSSSRIGPDPVGLRLLEMALCFGGETLTAAHIAVAAGLVDLGDRASQAHLDAGLLTAGPAQKKTSVETLPDQMKPGPEPVPAVPVGGGSVLIDGLLEGTGQSLRPEHFGSSNALGAAIAQVSDDVGSVVALEGRSSEPALEGIIAEARARGRGGCGGKLDPTGGGRGDAAVLSARQCDPDFGQGRGSCGHEILDPDIGRYRQDRRGRGYPGHRRRGQLLPWDADGQGAVARGQNRAGDPALRSRP